MDSKTFGNAEISGKLQIYYFALTRMDELLNEISKAGENNDSNIRKEDIDVAIQASTNLLGDEKASPMDELSRTLENYGTVLDGKIQVLMNETERIAKEL